MAMRQGGCKAHAYTHSAACSLPLQLALQLLQHERLEVGRTLHSQLDAGGSACAGQVRDAALAQQPRQLTQQILHRHTKITSVLCMFL